MPLADVSAAPLLRNRLTSDYLAATLPLGLQVRRCVEPRPPTPLIDPDAGPTIEELAAEDPPSIWVLHTFCPAATNAVYHGNPAARPYGLGPTPWPAGGLGYCQRHANGTTATCGSMGSGWHSLRNRSPGQRPQRATYKADVGGSTPSAPTLVSSVVPSSVWPSDPSLRVPSRVHRAAEPGSRNRAAIDSAAAAPRLTTAWA